VPSAERHALVIPLYGEITSECLNWLNAFRLQGFWVVAVNNNPSTIDGLHEVSSVVVNHHNFSGLAGGLNAGVAQAISDGTSVITLLDQDSQISPKSLSRLADACSTSSSTSLRIVGPCIWDSARHEVHSHAKSRARFMITSGTTFSPLVWSCVGSFQSWMEIDYIDHEWCSRAVQCGVQLEVISGACLRQTFGSRHPNRIAHQLGLQLYSPYRRSVAIRNLRWMLCQSYVPLDVRIKELIKILLKPWFWLLLEPNRRRTSAYIWMGLRAPLLRPFPRQRLEAMV
jgi:rhamnosyltransferase